MILLNIILGLLLLVPTADSRVNRLEGDPLRDHPGFQALLEE